MAKKSAAKPEPTPAKAAKSAPAPAKATPKATPTKATPAKSARSRDDDDDDDEDEDHNRAPRRGRSDGGDFQAVRATAELVKQASDPTRLQIMLLLVTGELHVGAICGKLKAISQPSVSHHLALLRHGRLIEGRREGKNNYYALTDRGRRLADTIGTLASR